MNTNTNANTNTNTNTDPIITTTTINPNNESNAVNMLYESSNQNLVNPEVIVEKKKRGRKKTIKTDVVLPNPSSDDTATNVTEKKIRKRRSKKNMALANANINSIESTDLIIEVVPGVKVRKRRVCKSKRYMDKLLTNTRRESYTK